MAYCQSLTLPEKPYVLIVGKDTFTTQTIIEHAPDLSGLSTSGNDISGVRLNLDNKNDTIGHKPIYLNGDSLRVWTYLCKGETYSIKFPQRIDTVTAIDLFTFEESVHVDTTDNILINHLVDTISFKELNKFFRTEIKVYFGNKKLKVRRISVMLVWKNGETYGINYEENKIGNYKSIKKAAQTISPDGYIILNRVWYYDENNEQTAMSGSIGWKIR